MQHTILYACTWCSRLTTHGRQYLNIRFDSSVRVAPASRRAMSTLNVCRRSRCVALRVACGEHRYFVSVFARWLDTVWIFWFNTYSSDIAHMTRYGRISVACTRERELKIRIWNSTSTTASHVRVLYTCTLAAGASTCHVSERTFGVHAYMHIRRRNHASACVCSEKSAREQGAQCCALN